MTANALDKHRSTQIQWHLCTQEEGSAWNHGEISIERKNKEIIKFDVFLLAIEVEKASFHFTYYPN